MKPSVENGGGALMAGGGCVPHLLLAAGSGAQLTQQPGERPLGLAAAMDDLVGQTISSYLTVRCGPSGFNGWSHASSPPPTVGSPTHPTTHNPNLHLPIQVADAVRAGGTCKAAAAAQRGGADFRRIAGMRFRHLEYVCVCCVWVVVTGGS